jgi:hypothetical protein
MFGSLQGMILAVVMPVALAMAVYPSSYEMHVAPSRSFRVF